MLRSDVIHYENDRIEVLTTPDDVIAEWLENKLSEASRESYGKSLRYFFCDTTGVIPTPDSVRWFLALSEQQALGLMLKWRSHMQHTLKLSPKSINARESAVRSFVQHARKRGLTQLALKDLGSLKAQVYRDVSGIDASAYSKVLQAIDRETLAGKRDHALMLLLWINALRRIEAVRANVRDLKLSDRRLAILAKGSGGERIYTDISTKVCNALDDYLNERSSTGGRSVICCPRL